MPCAVVTAGVELAYPKGLHIGDEGAMSSYNIGEVDRLGFSLNRREGRVETWHKPETGSYMVAFLVAGELYIIDLSQVKAKVKHERANY